MATSASPRSVSFLEMLANGSYAVILLATTDLDVAFARLQAGDAEVVQELR